MAGKSQLAPGRVDTTEDFAAPGRVYCLHTTELYLDFSGQKEPELNLDLSTIQRPVRHLDVSTKQGPDLHVSGQLEPLSVPLELYEILYTKKSRNSATFCLIMRDEILADFARNTVEAEMQTTYVDTLGGDRTGMN